MVNLTVMSIPFPTGARLVGPILGLLAVMVWRVREAKGPVSVKKIVIPPLGMATGMSMFVLPAIRVPWTWALGAVCVGALLLAYPLLRTTRLERDGDAIMMRRSNAFFAVLLGLFAIRFAARGYLDTILSGQQTAALAYLLAFGMIVRWRTEMFFEYRALTSGIALPQD